MICGDPIAKLPATTDKVDDKLRLIDVDIYYKADSFLLLGLCVCRHGFGLEVWC